MTGELVPAVHGEIVPVTQGDEVADTVRELYSEWIGKAAARSKHTFDAYRRDFKLFVDWLVGYDPDLGLLDVRGVHMAAYNLHLRNTPVRGGKPPKPATVARRLATVASFYDLARRREVLPNNPMDYVDRPEIDANHSDTRKLTLDEAKRLVDTAFGLVARTSRPDSKRVADRDSVIVAVLLVTGVRVSELCAMRVEDLGYHGGARTVTVTRKGGRRAAVALGAAAELVDRRVADRTEGPLFRTRSGRPVARNWVYDAIGRIAAAASIPMPHTVGPHALRHTFATLSLDRGCSLDVLQDALGHRDPRTTRRYATGNNRIALSPTHDLSKVMLSDRPDQVERLF